MPNKILILDDMIEEVRSYKIILESNGYEVETTDRAQSFFSAYERLQPNAVLLDIELREEQKTGVDVLEELQKKPFVPSVIVMSARASRTQMAEIMKYQVYGYIEKGRDRLSLDQFLFTIKNAVEMSVIRRRNLMTIQKQIQYQPMIYRSDAMKAIYEKAVKYAQTDQHILITGESGTGKEVLAKEIHFLSRRKEHQFIAVNVAAIPPSLFESESFGYVKGAFTGASLNNKTGFFEAADGGTLFLDEIGSAPYEVQSKFLRVLQNKRFNRVGEPDKERFSDFRLICATNLALPERIRQNQFRDDLYNRISTLTIELPPLRRRREDIFVLFDCFLRNHPERIYRHTFDYEPAAADTILKKHDWPGNARELQQFCARLIALHDHIDYGVIETALKEQLSGNEPTPAHEKALTESLMETPSFYSAVEAFEKAYIQCQLGKHAGHVRETARNIGMDLSTLYKKMQRYGIG